MQAAKKPRARKNTIKRKLTTVLELPADVMLDLPAIGLIGDEEATISNHKGIVEYAAGVLRVKTTIGIVVFGGENFRIKEISKENIVIVGRIDEMHFKRG